MHPPVSAVRWTAIRALREGEAPTFPRLAAATDLHPATIRERSCLEGWAKRPFQSRKAREEWAGRAAPAATSVSPGAGDAIPPGWEQMPPQDRLQWLNAFVSRQVAQIAAQAEGGALDKARMDALWSMIRMIERSETLALERAADKTGTGNDAELSARLEKLDDRIIELARAHAEWLVGTRDRQGLG